MRVGLLVLIAACGGGPSQPGKTRPDPGAICTPFEQYIDYDGDGFGQGQPSLACELRFGHATQGGDCDDTDPAINPAATEVCDRDDVDEDCDGVADDLDDDAQGGTTRFEDLDGDGFGGASLVACDTASNHVFIGGDCDDADPAVYPGAPEAWADGLDQDCDGVDAAVLRDSFELGAFDPRYWNVVDSSAVDEHPYTGQWSALVFDGESLTSQTFDSSSCTEIHWSFCAEGLSGSELELALDTVGGWQQVALHVTPLGIDDDRHACYAGVRSDPDVLWPGLRVRLQVVGRLDYVDDLVVGCTGVDADGDGYGALEDCDDTDDRHWSDCGLCVDPDGDHVGVDCDLGPDCDPADGSFGAYLPDAPGDGIDHDCDGIDGKYHRSDYESGHLYREPRRGDWSDEAILSNFRLMQGEHYLTLPPGAWVETPTLNAAACPSISWSYLGRRSADLLPGEALRLDYFDGADWVEVDSWLATGELDVGAVRRTGSISDGAALHDRLALRLTNEGSGSLDVDAWTFGCVEDADGDSFSEAEDCDESDPAHWSDCGLCDDADGDGFGGRCDLGVDCDDSDASVSPLGIEISGDGVDQDCDGLDVDVPRDSFEAGIDPGWTAAGTVFSTDRAAATGARSVRLVGDGAELRMPPVDTTACTEVGWVFAAKRGPDPPQLSGALAVEAFDGAMWVPLDAILGTGQSDLEFALHGGSTGAAWAIRPDLELRWIVSAVEPLDAFLVDDIAVGCVTGDQDGDGIGVPLDCDDSDAGHSRDCWTCFDADLDGIPARCDTGIADCSPNDAAVGPYSLDVFGDRVDTDCNGWDGPGFRDGFERGTPDPAVWTNPVGGWTVDRGWTGWGTHSLEFTEDGRIESRAFDTSTCVSVEHRVFYGSADVPATSGSFWPEIWSDGAWQWAGQAGMSGSAMSEWTQYGPFDDYLHPDFQYGVRVSGLTVGTAHMDEVRIRCIHYDVDGDGFTTELDCDDDDPDRWADCDTCQDADGDGYGPGCLKGADCDDGDIAINPGRIDTGAAGFDVNCDEMAGTRLIEDFEDDVLDGVEALFAPGAVAVGSHVGLGEGGVRMLGGGVLTTRAVDVTECAEVGWFALVQRGPDPPDAVDTLEVEYFDGAAWYGVDSIPGTGTVDPVFLPYMGRIDEPAALHSDFQLRIVATGSGEHDVWYVDDIRVGCATP